MDPEAIELMIMNTRIGSIDFDTGGLKVDFDNPIRFSCSSTTVCCKQLDIQLSEIDIHRIESQGYELDQFLEELPQEISIPWDSQAKPVKYYILKKRAFDRQCVFLEKNLCKIHEFKPQPCRIFPFSLRSVGETELDVYLHPANFCKSVLPGDGENNDNEKWLKFLLEEEIRYMAEQTSYDKKFGK